MKCENCIEKIVDPTNKIIDCLKGNFDKDDKDFIENDGPDPFENCPDHESEWL